MSPSFTPRKTFILLFLISITHTAVSLSKSVTRREIWKNNTRRDCRHLKLLLFLGRLIICILHLGAVYCAESINLARLTFLDPGSLFLRNKSYWIHEGPSKSVQVSSCGVYCTNILHTVHKRVVFCMRRTVWNCDMSSSERNSRSCNMCLGLDINWSLGWWLMELSAVNRDISNVAEKIGQTTYFFIIYLVSNYHDNHALSVRWQQTNKQIKTQTNLARRGESMHSDTVFALCAVNVAET